jgi:flagella basal body P-ring formation protein FlgA
LISKVLFSILVSVSAQAELQTLKIRPYNRIFENTKISLLEVVDRDGLAPDVEKKLAAVYLGDAPKMGEQRIYTNKAIAEAIRNSRFQKNWGLQIPHKVVVDNRGFDMNRETVEQELLARWSTMCSDCQIRIKSMQMPALPSQLANAPWEIENDNKLPRGNFAQKVLITGIDGRIQIYWLNGQIEIKKKVPVLARSTPMSTRFTEDDFSFQWRDVTFSTDTTPTAKEIIGQQAKFTMNANDIIWRGNIVREKAIQRGEVVRVVIGDDNWQVTTQAMSEQDGYVGDTVNLKNLQSKKIISGRVVASGEVEAR